SPSSLIKHFAPESPVDPRFLPVVASAYMSGALSALRGGASDARWNFPREGSIPDWYNMTDLQHIRDSAGNTEDERASAVLMMGLHPQGGWQSVLDSKSAL